MKRKKKHLRGGEKKSDLLICDYSTFFTPQPVFIEQVIKIVSWRIQSECFQTKKALKKLRTRCTYIETVGVKIRN